MIQYSLAPLIITLGADMKLLLDVVQLAMHVRDFGAQSAPIVILLSTAELIVQLRSLGAKVPILAPNVTAGPILAHLAFNMRHHTVHVVNLALQFAQAISAMLKGAVVAVVRPSIVSALIVNWLIVNGLLLLRNVLVVIVGSGCECETGKAQHRRRRSCDGLFHIGALLQCWTNVAPPYSIGLQK